MASLDDEKLKKLVGRLMYGTESNRIEWEETDRKQAYLYSPGAYSVLIASMDNDGLLPFALQIIDATGDVIESIVSHEGNEGEGYRENLGASQLERLHSMVRRQALGVDRAIDELMESLPIDPDEDPPF